MIAKTLILVCGMPGAGKTTLARELATRLHLFYLDKDLIQDQFTVERSGENYRRIKQPSYNVIYNLAAVNLELGNSVIIDSPFITAEYFPNPVWINQIESLATERGAKIKVVWCSIDRQERLRRLADRGRYSARDQLQLSQFEKDKDVEPNVPFSSFFFNSAINSVEEVVNFLTEETSRAAEL